MKFSHYTFILLFVSFFSELQAQENIKYIKPNGLQRAIDYSFPLLEKSVEKDTILTPYDANQIFLKQKNRFEFRSDVFYFNNIAINLFENIEDIKAKIDSNFKSEHESYLELTKDVFISLTKYKDKRYVVGFQIALHQLYQPELGEFGVFLIDGFPFNGAILQIQENKKIVEAYNKHSTDTFEFNSNTGNYTSKKKEVFPKDLNMLNNYFPNYQKYIRSRNRKIYSEINWKPHYISLGTQMTFEGDDPYEKPIPTEKKDIIILTPPKGN